MYKFGLVVIHFDPTIYSRIVPEHDPPTLRDPMDPRALPEASKEVKEAYPKFPWDLDRNWWRYGSRTSEVVMPRI